MKVGRHVEYLSDIGFQPGFLEQFPAGSVADIFSVVDKTGRHRPETGSGRPFGPFDHKEATRVIEDHYRRPHARIPEVNEPTRRTRRTWFAADDPHRESGAAPGTVGVLAWPVVGVRHARMVPKWASSPLLFPAAIMETMRRGTDTPPVITGILQMAAALTTAVGAVFAVGATDRQLLAGSGLLVVTTVGVVGLFLARGRWARRYLWFAIGIESAMFVIFATGSIVLAMIGVAAVSLGSPGLDGWIRQLRKADAAPHPAVVLPLLLLTVPALTGLVRQPNTFDWILTGLVVVLAWSYGRAHLPTLWILRLLYPIVSLLVAFATPGWSGLALGALAAAATALAWSPGALRGIQPLEARRVDARPVFAEMAPPGLMEEIGRDRSGKQLP